MCPGQLIAHVITCHSNQDPPTLRVSTTSQGIKLWSHQIIHWLSHSSHNPITWQKLLSEHYTGVPRIEHKAPKLGVVTPAYIPSNQEGKRRFLSSRPACLKQQLPNKQNLPVNNKKTHVSLHTQTTAVYTNHNNMHFHIHIICMYEYVYVFVCTYNYIWGLRSQTEILSFAAT